MRTPTESIASLLAPDIRVEVLAGVGHSTTLLYAVANNPEAAHADAD